MAVRDAQNHVSGHELVHVPAKCQKFTAILVSAQSLVRFKPSFFTLSMVLSAFTCSIKSTPDFLPPTRLRDLDATFLDLFINAYSFIMLWPYS